MRPERSSRSRKAILPWPRRAARRPATRWETSVSSPAVSAAWASRTAAIGSTPLYSCGNGSTPAARSSSSLRRRVAKTSSGSSPKAEAPLLVDVDLGDLQVPLSARGCEGDLLPALAADQGLAHRRLVGELGLGRIGLGGADDRVLGGLPVLVLDVYDRAHPHHVGAQVGLVDHGRRAKFFLQ